MEGYVASPHSRAVVSEFESILGRPSSGCFKGRELGFAVAFFNVLRIEVLLVTGLACFSW